MSMKYKNVLKRKLIVACITSVIYTIIIVIYKGAENAKELLLLFPIYFLYSAPVILVYGSLTSYISEVISLYITKNKLNWSYQIYTFIFHVIFGLVLLLYSLVAAILFFIIDFFLQKHKTKYSIKHVCIALCVLIGIEVFTIFIINLMG